MAYNNTILKTIWQKRYYLPAFIKLPVDEYLKYPGNGNIPGIYKS